MHKEGQDVPQVGLAHLGYLLDGRQAAANGPSIPFPEILLGWLGNRSEPEAPDYLFDRPGPRSLQVEFFGLSEALGVLGRHILHPVEPELPSALESIVTLGLQTPMLVFAHLIDRFVHILHQVERIMHDLARRAR